MSIQDFYYINCLYKAVYIWINGVLYPLSLGKFTKLADGVRFSVDGSGKEWVKQNGLVLPV